MAKTFAAKKAGWFQNIKVMDAKEATLAARPRYNAYVCGTGAMKSRKEKVEIREKNEFRLARREFTGY